MCTICHATCHKQICNGCASNATGVWKSIGKEDTKARHIGQVHSLPNNETTKKLRSYKKIKDENEEKDDI